MATPAAVLQVLIDANTASATADLRRFDAALKRTDSTTATATTRTNTLGKATRTTGSHLASAARYAAGAAAAYLSIAQAKDAITTTQDLAKTTAGLNRNLGMTVKEGSRWASVAKSRDVDAKSLTMSFTTLSRRLVDTSAALKEGGSAADTAYAPFKRLGISQQEVMRGSKDLDGFLPKLAEGFGDAAGGAERQASAQQLLGRGYQSLLPLFAGGAKGLEEQQKWADKYGTTLNTKTLGAQMDLVEAQRESKVAILGLQVAFAQALTPALEKANDVLQRFARIIGSDKLTQAEKFEKLGQIIGKWADKAYDAFVQILPKMVSAAGNKAPEIARAFVEGFLRADIWGKLLIGGWLFAKMGGLGAFTALGTKAGKSTGTSFARSFKGAILAGGLLVAIDQALTTRGGVLDTLAGRGSVSITEKLQSDFGDLGKAIKTAIQSKDLQALRELDGLMQAMAQSSVDSGQKVPRVLEKMIDAVDRARGKMGDDLNQTSDGFKDFADAVARAAGISVPKSVDRAGDNVERGAKRMAGDLDKTGDDSRDFGKRWDKNFSGVAKIVGSASDAVGKGLDTIGKNTNSLLKGLKVGSVSYSIAKAGKGVMDGATQFKQRGGHINLGAPSGDTVPAMLERGEYVLNRNAVSRVGKDRLDAINFGAAPRFQRGGGLDFALGPYDIPPIQYAADHAGGNSHVHITGTTTPWVVAIGKKLQQMGFMVGEHPAFGGVQGSHSATGGHYDALAIDVNSAADETRSEVAQIARLLGSGNVSAGMEKIKRLILNGPDGPLKTGGQSALDMARGAANKLISRAQASSVGVESGGGALSESEFLGLAKRALYITDKSSVWGGSEGFSAAGLLALAKQESSLVPSSINNWDINAAAGNPSGGLMHLTQSNMKAYAEPSLGSNMFDPLASIAASINYQIDRYGGQVTRSPYQKGGLVNYLQGGGSPTFNPIPPPMFNPSGPTRMAEPWKTASRLAKQFPLIDQIDERIDIAQRFADLDGEFSESERLQAVTLNTDLLRKLIAVKEMSQFGLDKATKKLSRPGTPGYERASLRELVTTFTTSLQDVQGLTGSGGRILDTMLTLRELGSNATTASTVNGLSFSQLLDIAQATNYGVFDRMPVMHNGGVVPGPIGADVPIMAQGGETVTPVGGGGDVHIYIDGQKLDEAVDYRVELRDRQTNMAYRAGATR